MFNMEYNFSNILHNICIPIVFIVLFINHILIKFYFKCHFNFHNKFEKNSRKCHALNFQRFFWIILIHMDILIFCSWTFCSFYFYFIFIFIHHLSDIYASVVLFYLVKLPNSERNLLIYTTFNSFECTKLFDL